MAKNTTDKRKDKNPDLDLAFQGINKKFGEGVVISTEGSEANTRVQVSFDEVGIKWLILAVANLEII